MIRSVFALAVIGIVGLIVIATIFKLLLPLVFLAVQLAIVLLVGYLILRLVSPKKAEEVREKLRRVK